MRTHTREFKEQISLLGKQQDVLITYNDITLTTEQINSVTYAYEASLLKSVMKELDIESNEPISVGTEINFKYGILVGKEYEYLDYGQFIVKSIEKQEDTDSYIITCYDKLLYSMVDYVSIDLTFPTTVYDYLNAICKHLGLQLASNSFANSDKSIPSDLYSGLGYTFRDVLDEIAEVTGSVICINSDDAVEVRYIKETNDTIDEEYFKDINVNFGEKYGPINSIVLSRSGESDNVFLQNETSIEENGLCELKILDNQIMNFNNRADFLPDLLSALGGIEYYLNDFSSTGIMYYDLLDRYTVHIGDNYYSCVMLNDEQDITQGLEEQIYTDMPETSKTDYTKADKTDQRINQTYIIVDKQNQTIQSVVSQTDAQNQKISVVEQTVNELNSKIGDIADITTSKESTNGMVSFEKINQSEPIYVRIYPTGENISFLYPHANLFPSGNLYLKVRTLRFTNTTTKEYFDYELPTDLLYYDAENYDEFILDYDAQKCEVNKRVGYNADGTTYILENQKTIEYEYPRINLTDGDYTIELLGYHNAYLFVRLMAQNIYTTQFATKAELNSEISQTTSEINLSVDKKLTNYPTITQMNSAISVKSNEITSTVSTTYATKTENNNTLNSAKGYTDAQVTTAKGYTDQQVTIAKSEIKQTTDSISLEVGKKVNNEDFTGANITLALNNDTSSTVIKSDKISLNGKEINLTSGNTTITSDNFSVDRYGKVTMRDAHILGGDISMVSDGSTPTIEITNGDQEWFEVYTSNLNMRYWYPGDDAYVGQYLQKIGYYVENEATGESSTVAYFGITTPKLTQTSLAEQKKNFEKFEDNAIEILKDIDIYKYNLKSEEDTDKKHIGFVIGEDYNYSKEVTSIDNKGVDIYSFASLCAKAIQEQQQIIEQLQKEIKELKESEK